MTDSAQPSYRMTPGMVFLSGIQRELVGRFAKALKNIFALFTVSFPFLPFVKLREREGQGVDPGRSLKGHL